MKQVVRFASTPGGRIAYSVVGSGPPIVYLLGWVSHLGLAWEMPSHRRFVEALAQDHTVIRYDKLGCGLSDRPREAFTLESELETLDALIGHLGLKRYTIFGSCEGGQVAAAHAVRNPDAVASLLVYGSCARGGDLAPDPVKRSILSLIGAHWGMGSRVLADIWFPGAPAEVTDMFARVQRAAATAEMAAALLDMFYRIDVADILPAIRVPTLVLHRRGSRAVPFELGRELASLIPGAQLVALEGRMQPIYFEGEDIAAATILSFLRDRAGGTGRLSTDPRLTDRELQVVAHIAEGLTNAEIARLLGVSVRTVDAHVEHVRTKLGVRSRAQMAVWVSEQRQSRGLLRR
ncbi:alpha/beta fold hydrolase [Nonomuraea sp. NPDC049709]|uniref:alpha/beta fold hydrolase n=1 Tax=Nonomuraea sp. NPDC049709 TaxID=3154736 RepID=UPI00341CD4AC